MSDYVGLTDDIEFDLVLELAQDDGIGNVLTIPGVWEHVREHYNNEVLSLYERRYMENDDE